MESNPTVKAEMNRDLSRCYEKVTKDKLNSDTSTQVKLFVLSGPLSNYTEHVLILREQ